MTFFLPFYEEYGNYDRNEIFSRMLESVDNELINEVWDEAISDLYELFDDMETQSRDWHSSRC